MKPQPAIRLIAPRSESHMEERIRHGFPPWTSMSFACGGWLQFYLFGVARAVQSRGLDKDVVYCGCSAGALAAAGLILDGDFDSAIQFCKKECVPEAYGKLLGLFQLSKYVGECIDDNVIPNYKSIPPGTLNVAITKLPFFTAERVSTFDSEDDLKTVLLASCAAFPFAGLVYRKGSWYIDGGLSDFQPVLEGEHTLTVSPFYFSDCDIKPSRYVPPWWAFLPPRSTDTIDWLYNLGWQDGMQYFDKIGIPASTPTSRKHLQAVDKSWHPYDIPRRVSMHRFLGYDFRNITTHYVMFILDLFLLMQVFLIWKPLCLILIYIELLISSIVNIIVYSIFAAIDDFYDVTIQPLLFGKMKMCDTYTYTHPIGESISMNKLDLDKDNDNPHPTDTPQSKRSWKTVKEARIVENFKCIMSLSLLLRFLSFKPSHVPLKKHNQLVKASLCYRIFRHLL